MENTSPRRLAALDGLRGIAAVIVFLHHALMVFYPLLMGNNHREAQHGHRALLAWFQHLPLGWIFNGPFAVSFFFVLSGFVLTLQVSQSATDVNFPRLLVRRFLRLFPLVFLASCVGFVVFERGLSGLDALGTYNGIMHQDFFEPALLDSHGFTDLLTQVFYAVWHNAPAQRLFDPVLWSIGTEFQGSILVYLLLSTLRPLHQPALRYVASGGVLLGIVGPAGLCFLVGMMAADRYMQEGRLLAVPNEVLVLLAGTALTFASVNPFRDTWWLTLPVALPSAVAAVVQAVASFLIMAAALQVPALTRAMSTRTALFLGFISYGLYVLHMPLMYALAAPTAARLAPMYSYEGAVAIAVTLTFAVSVLGGYALIRWVDVPVNGWCRKWVAKIVS